MQFGIGRMTEVAVAPLSVAQEWMLDLETQWEAAHSALSMVFALALDGPLDRAAMASAISAVTARHPALRTTFASDDQQVVAPEPVALTLESVTPADLSARTDAVAATPLDLRAGPVFSATLLSGGKHSHRLVCSAHHASFDARSWQILFQEVSRWYDQVVDGGGVTPTLGPIPKSQLQYAIESRSPAKEQARSETAAYWQARFATERQADPSNLLPPILESRSHVVPAAGLGEAIRARARRQRLTPFALLLTADAILAAAWSGQDEVLLQTPRDERLATRYTDTIGCLVGLLLMKVPVSGGETAAALSGVVWTELLAATMNREVHPLMVNDLVPRPFEFYGENETPLPAFSGISSRSWPVLVSKRAASTMMHRDFKPVVMASVGPDDLAVTVELDGRRYDDRTFRRIAAAYSAALEVVVHRPTTEVGAVLDTCHDHLAR
jgi:condensation domain-containing protein